MASERIEDPGQRAVNGPMRGVLKVVLLVIWAAAFIIGAIAVYEQLTSPVDSGNTTSYVVWGLYVPTYMYFIGASAGAFLLSVIVNVLSVKKLEPTVKLSLYTALVLLIIAIGTIALDLGHPERAIETLYRPQFHSVLVDVVWLYVIYFTLLLVELLLLFRLDVIEGRLGSLGGSARINNLISKLLRPRASSPERLKRSAESIRKSFLYLGAFGLVLALGFHGGVGSILATIYFSYPWWTTLLPIMFIAGALFSGAALLTAILVLLWPRKDDEFREMIAYLGRIVYWLLIGNAVLIAFDLVIPVWYGTGDPVSITITNEVLFGQYWYVFWIFEVLLGFIVPGILLSNRFRNRPIIVGIGSAFAGIFYYAVRLVEVIPAFAVPKIPGLQYAYVDPKLVYTYFPSIHEWEVVMFMAAFGIGLLYLGYRLLPLVPRAADSTMPGRGRGGSTAPIGGGAGGPKLMERRGFLRSASLATAGFLAAVSINWSALTRVASSALAYGGQAARALIARERERLAAISTKIIESLARREGAERPNLVEENKLVKAAGEGVVAVSPLVAQAAQVAVATKTDFDDESWSQPYTWLPGQPTIQVPAGYEQSPIYRMMEDLKRALAKPANQRKWVMVIDARKCVGCSACTVACKVENKEPPGVVYRPVVVSVHGSYPNVSATFLPRPCMQCDDPPCVRVCPVGATFKRPDGIVAIDYNACMGCRYCISACPYQARTFDWGLNYTDGTPKIEYYDTWTSFEYGVDIWDRPVDSRKSPKFNAHKCHFCIHRLESGMLPACVTTCIGRATYFGDLNDPDSLVSKLIREQGASRLKEELGTEPNVYYIGLTEPMMEEGVPLVG